MTPEAASLRLQTDVGHADAAPNAQAGKPHCPAPLGSPGHQDWFGLARMARARQVAGQALDDADREALCRAGWQDVWVVLGRNRADSYVRGRTRIK